MPIPENIIIFALIVVDVVLLISILMQQRSGGLSTVFGGESSAFRQKRGIALGLHYFTIVLAIIFAALSIGILFVQ